MLRTVVVLASLSIAHGFVGSSMLRTGFSPRTLRAQGISSLQMVAEADKNLIPGRPLPPLPRLTPP